MNAPLNHDALASIADELVGAGNAADVAERAAPKIARHSADMAALRMEIAQALWESREAISDSDPYFGGGSAWS